MVATMPDLRASKAEKKNKEWYIPMADFVIDLATASSNKELTKQCINAANNIVSKKDYAYVMKTYGTGSELTSKEIDLDADKLGILRDIDILTPIKEKYMGEFINSYHNYQVYSNDPETIFKRNSAIGSKVVDKMFKKLEGILSQDEDAANFNIKSFVDNELEEWQDDIVSKEQRTLELLNTVIDARRKYTDAYFNWWSTEEVYTYRRLVGNDIHFEVVSPLEYYRVDSGEYFVEDDSFGCRRYVISLQDIIDRFYNQMEDGLSEKQMELLKKLASQSVAGVGTITSDIYSMYKDLFPSSFKFNKPIKFTKKGLLVTIDHWVGKVETKKGILTYISPLGTEEIMDVDEDYELDTANGDISIEWKYINEVWEGWRFGENDLKLYIPARPIDLPRELISNSSVCKLPYNGISYIHKNSEKKPIPYRIRDNIILYKIYTLLEERWINKFKSWMLIPESILADSKEYSAPDRLQQADIDSMFPFNDTLLQQNPNLVNYIKEVATQGVVEYIKVLNQVKESIKENAWELANMNSARFGSNGQYKGKAVSEYDYNQAVKGTVWSLEMFNSFRERDYMANLDYSRAAWIDGKQGSYIDPNTNEPQYVDVIGEEHLGANVGIYIANSAELNAQAEALKQLAFSAGQNNDPVLSAEAITNKNIGKLKKIIREATKANKEFQLKMATAKEEAMAKIKELELADNREQRQHDETVLDKTLGNEMSIAILESETKIEIEEARLEVDRNGNGYIDMEESQNTPDTIAAKQRAVAKLEDRKATIAKLKIGVDNLNKQKALASKNKTAK